MFSRCPSCGAKLLEVGYPDETGFQELRCPNDCKFEAPLSWKLWNAVGFSLYLFILSFTLLITAPLMLVAKAIELFGGLLKVRQ